MPRLVALRRHYRAVMIVIAGAMAAVTSNLPGERVQPVDGLLYDLSLAVTDRRPGTVSEPVVVVTLDRDSLADESLAPLPRAFLSPVWAKLTDGLVASGVRAIGFDIVFEYSANRFPGLAGEYEKPFLTALARARDRIVLARAARAVPAPPFVAAVLDPGADADLIADADGVYRWVSASTRTGRGPAVPSLAAAVLARAKAWPMPERVLLAPRRPLEAIPAYRLIDVLHCLDHDPAAMRHAFAGKIVMIGTNLPEEDRKRTPDRFMPAMAAGGSAEGSSCALTRLGASDPGSGTSPGVFVHAAAIAQVADGQLVEPLPLAARAAAAALAAIGGALLALLSRPWVAALGLATIVAAGFIAASLLLGFGWWLTLGVPLGGALLAAVLAYIVRFLVEERRRRNVQNAFGHYLAPSLVARLAESAEELHLGGEEREVTVMFADLSGFTAMSGRLRPGPLMALTNAYLALLVAAVEETGGYVDKFIGDAVMGIWGAPARNPDHAAAAARTALHAVAAVMSAKAVADVRGEPGFAVKIGINSGAAVVGNVGAARRFNYTAVGDTVNVAARLEGVPGDYGCRIVVGPLTAALISDRFVLCELDWIKVKGKEQAIAIYELLGERAGAKPEELDYVEHYRAALELYRVGSFAEAAEYWRARVRHPHLDAAGQSPPAVMAERAAELAEAPPPGWNGVFVKTTK